MPEIPRSIKDFFRCLFGIHCVPKDWAFEDMAAIFAGGICLRCGVVKAGKFICNTWTGQEQRSDGVIMLTGFDISAATRQGYKVLGNIDDLYEIYEAYQEEKKLQRAAAR